jgi:hypothetical protein
MSALEVVHGKKADHESNQNAKRDFHSKILSLRGFLSAPGF